MKGKVEESWLRVCDECGVKVFVTDENYEGFALSWYESLLFDLCPLCQSEERINRDRKFKRELQAQMEKRLTRTAQNSH